MNPSDLPQPPNPPYLAPLPTSTLAIISLIGGIAGFTFLPLLGSIVALITGYMARGETRANPPTASGDGLATAGIILGYVQIGLAVIGLCCFLLYFLFVGGLVLSAGGSGH
jgi:hypothetical protein